jgi:hypothetical protein
MSETCISVRGASFKVRCRWHWAPFIIHTIDRNFQWCYAPSSSAPSESKLFIEQVSLFIPVWMSVAACDTWAISPHYGVRVTAQLVGSGWLAMGRRLGGLKPIQKEMFSPSACRGRLPERTEQPVNEYFKPYNEPSYELYVTKAFSFFLFLTIHYSTIIGHHKVTYTNQPIISILLSTNSGKTHI